MSTAISIGRHVLEITLDIMSGIFNPAVWESQHPKNSMELDELSINKHLLLVEYLKGWE